MKRAVYRIQIMIRHCNDIFATIYRRFPDLMDVLPMNSEYRMYMLSFHLVIWEVFALCNPEDMCIDPYDVLIGMKGGGLFQNYILPNGYVFSNIYALRGHGLEDRALDKNGYKKDMDL